MLSLQHTDLCFGESLEKLTEATKEIKSYKQDMDNQKMLKHVGQAICFIWEARNILYKKEPSIKRDFKQEADDEPQRFEKLIKIYQEALKLEEKKDFEKASKIYENLLDTSKYGYFKLLSQAGLYRCLSKSC